MSPDQREIEGQRYSEMINDENGILKLIPDDQEAEIVLEVYIEDVDQAIRRLERSTSRAQIDEIRQIQELKKVTR